jgi:hypothetical protein
LNHRCRPAPARASIGLPPTGWFLDTVTRAQLYMQLTAPGFEYPRRDLAPNVHFIGAMPAPAPRDWTPPAWWPTLDGSRPVVHLTQGTVANRVIVSKPRPDRRRAVLVNVEAA